MTQAIKAYRAITVSNEFKEIERLRDRASHDEASALQNARREAAREATKKANKKWQGVLEEAHEALAGKDAALAGKDEALAGKDAEIARLRAILNETRQ